MEVLELPRPVINFMRSISKEMHRYTLSWDMFGASDSVSLTLTWKLNYDSNDGEDTVKRSRKQHQQKINDLIQSTQTESSDTSLENNPKYCTKKSSLSKSSAKLNQQHRTPAAAAAANSTRKQMQHFKLDSVADELLNKKSETEVGSSGSHKHRSHGKQKSIDSLHMRRNLSAESLQPKGRGKNRHSQAFQTFDKHSRHQQQQQEQQHHYRSSSLSRGKSLENYEKLNDTAACPCCEKYKNLEDLNDVLKFSSLRLQKTNKSGVNGNSRRSIIKNHEGNEDTSQYYYQPRVQFDTGPKPKARRNNPTSYDNDFLDNSGSQSEDSTTTISGSGTISDHNNNEVSSNPWIKRNNVASSGVGGHSSHLNNYKELSSLNNSMNYMPKSSFYDFNSAGHNLNDSDLFQSYGGETTTHASNSGHKVRFFKG